MIKIDEVKKIARLAKLRFSEDEFTNFAQQLSTIMVMIDSLNEVNCEGVEPLRSVSDNYQRLRKDEITSGDISDEIFANVPGQDKEFARKIKCFIVPKVIE